MDDDGANKFAQKDDSNPSSFSLFPNPTSDDVTMKFRADNISNAKMVIYNMQGIEVYEKNIPITTIGTQSINIPLSNIIPSGNYIVNLSVDDQVYKKTIIIQ